MGGKRPNWECNRLANHESCVLDWLNMLLTLREHYEKLEIRISECDKGLQVYK